MGNNTKKCTIQREKKMCKHVQKMCKKKVQRKKVQKKVFKFSSDALKAPKTPQFMH